VGAALWERGLAARAAGDAEVAYRAFRDLVSFEPWRSWARRYAEDARDARLGLVRGPPVDDERLPVEGAAEAPPEPPPAAPPDDPQDP
jgi:hypothetical protein